MNAYDHLPPKTLADYLAIAVSPVLIMVMVGSLNFFLAEVGYRGAFSGQVYWTLFWFTLASVLVSRISIEHGSAYGSVYGLALGAATGFRLVPFLGAPWGALLLLGLIWWCASKLTWDCTVIDDHADASDQGLIEHLKTAKPKTPAGAASDDVLPGRDQPKPHAPGRWLIYTSLGALPIFGLGQWLIPAADTSSRLRAFGLAVLFVAAAVALLLTASFAGLRRYLRQRRLTMPPPMAAAWMARGSVVAALIVFGALLLPRPRGLDTWANLGLELRERDPRASKYAWMRGEAAKGEGRRIGEPGAPGGNRADGRSTEPSEAREAAGQDRAGGGADAGTPRDGSGGGEASRRSKPASTAPSLPEVSAGGWLAWVRGISLLTAILAIAWVLWRFGPQWLAALKASWRRPSAAPPPASAAPAPRRRRFAEFEDPFRHGGSTRMTPDELAVYTFEALEAWAADRGRERPPDQTPLSFGRDLEGVLDERTDDLRSAVRLYLRAAYGGGGTLAEETDPLRRLWQAMR
ncbi:MAG: DUF4129 domain-containing protein [Verrucomicrobiales bacterium]|nr:DUF4129 domain-containing protein [Verrucomicrobiales bacterium]